MPKPVSSVRGVSTTQGSVRQAMSYSIVAVGISPGMTFENQPGKLQRPMRYIRSFEFDGTNAYFPNFVLNELLPAVEKLKMKNGRAIHLARDGSLCDFIRYIGAPGDCVLSALSMRPVVFACPSGPFC